MVNLVRMVLTCFCENVKIFKKREISIWSIIGVNALLLLATIDCSIWGLNFQFLSNPGYLCLFVAFQKESRIFLFIRGIRSFLDLRLTYISKMPFKQDIFLLLTPGGGGFGVPSGQSQEHSSPNESPTYASVLDEPKDSSAQGAQYGSYFDYLRSWNESV